MEMAIYNRFIRQHLGIRLSLPRDYTHGTHTNQATPASHPFSESAAAAYHEHTQPARLQSCQMCVWLHKYNNTGAFAGDFHFEYIKMIPIFWYWNATLAHIFLP